MQNVTVSVAVEEEPENHLQDASHEDSVAQRTVFWLLVDRL